MALFRAIESNRSKMDRLFYDPFASNFLDTRLNIVVKISSIPIARNITSKLIERQAPGAFSSGCCKNQIYR